MSQADWDKASSAALALFAFGQQEASQRGLLLVDTKYELGKDTDGNILLLDEVRPLTSQDCSSQELVVLGGQQLVTVITTSCTSAC